MPVDDMHWGVTSGDNMLEVAAKFFSPEREKLFDHQTPLRV